MTMQQTAYDTQTDSHLSKNYNNILGFCIQRTNDTGYIMEADPHFDNLRAYFAAIYILYRNTFFLFHSIKMGNINQEEVLADLLFNKMKRIKEFMRDMKKNKAMQSPENFERLMGDCDIVHMLIMDGLQKRRMLVRESEKEPRGKDTVFYWHEKESFKKGGLKDYLNSPLVAPVPRRMNISEVFKN